MTANSKRIRIPNVDVRLTPAEVEVLHTSTFQRLFGINQLGLAYLVYPFATHSRGAHSIRCLHEAARILDSVDEADSSDVRMAALLHDIGHLPFSHTLEDEHSLLEKHDRPDRINQAIDLLVSELRTRSASSAIEAVEAAKPILLMLAKAGSTQTWKSDLIGNTICADLLAYIHDDAAYTGIEKRPGHYRVYDYFTIHNDRLCIPLTKGGLRTDIVSAILDLMDMRYALTERITFHHAKALASAMLARCCTLLSMPPIPELLTMTDHVFLHQLREEAIRSAPPQSDWNKSGPGLPLHALAQRRLYKRFFKIGGAHRTHEDTASGKDFQFIDRWRNTEYVADTLARIETACQLPRGALAIWCPDARSGLKLVEANVLWSTRSGTHGPVTLNSEDVRTAFPSVHTRVSTAQTQYNELWTFWAGLHPDYWHRVPYVFHEFSREVAPLTCDSMFFDEYLEQDDTFHRRYQLLQRVATVADGTTIRATEQLVDSMAATGEDEPTEGEIEEALRNVQDQYKREPVNKPGAEHLPLPGLNAEDPD